MRELALNSTDCLIFNSFCSLFVTSSRNVRHAHQLLQVWEIGDLVDLVVCRLHCGNHYHHDYHLDNAIVFMIFIVMISI